MWQEKSKLTLLKVVLVVIACSPTGGFGSDTWCKNNGQPRVASLQEADLPSIYRFLLWLDLDTEQLDRAHERLPCRSMELERTSCHYGSCPSYVVTLRADGTASYRGRSFVQKEGRYRGEVSIFALARLCYLAERIGIDRMQRKYRAPRTDDRTTIVRIQRTDEVLEISDYGGVGPIELWGLFMAIDAVGENIQWVSVAGEDGG